MGTRYTKSTSGLLYLWNGIIMLKQTDIYQAHKQRLTYIRHTNRVHYSTKGPFLPHLKVS